MKTRILLLFVAAALAPWGWAVESLTKKFQEGLVEEEANRDFPAAIRAYEQVLADFEQHRQIAAGALYRLGESYRKLGRTNEAAAAFEQLLLEFHGQELLVKLARQNLQLLRPDDPALAAEGPAPPQDPEWVEIQQLERIIRNNPDFINAPDESGLTPLHRAARDGKIRLVQVLLDNGAQPGRKDDRGWTPLHYAVFHAYQETAELLVAAGAEVNLLDNQKAAPLHLAAFNGFTALGRFLLANGADTEIRGTVMTGLTIQKKQSGTPLEFALRGEHFDLAEQLLEHGADIHSPLPFIVDSLRPLRWLLDRGADPNFQAEDGTTPLHWAPLHWALARSALNSMELLLERGANPNLADSQGTPLHLAARSREPHRLLPFLDMLHRHGADLNARDDRENTPLHAAVQQGNMQNARRLVELGAEINPKNKLGQTPYDLARTVQPPGKRASFAAFLKEQGGRPAQTTVSLEIRWAQPYRPRPESPLAQIKRSVYSFNWPFEQERSLYSLLAEELDIDLEKTAELIVVRNRTRPGPTSSHEQIKIPLDPDAFKQKSQALILEPDDIIAVTPAEGSDPIDPLRFPPDRTPGFTPEPLPEGTGAVPSRP
jgi:ankyrin repeat protein